MEHIPISALNFVSAVFVNVTKKRRIMVLVRTIADLIADENKQLG
jgi:hypothetical protein